MTDSTPWLNTRAALKDFMLLLSCNKCKQRPTDPVRYTDCQHLFCSNCVQQDANCFVCNIPVQQRDIRADYTAAAIIAGCDGIAEIIFANEIEETHQDKDLKEAEFDINASPIFSSTRFSKGLHQETDHKEKKRTILEETDESYRNEETHQDKGREEVEFDINASQIFSSTRFSKGLHRETDHKEIERTILQESVESDKTEKLDSEDETVRVNDSDEFETRSTANIIPSSIISGPSKSKRNFQSLKTSAKDSRKVPKNINKRNRKGETLLHQACLKGKEEEVKFLLESGANPNTKDNANWTPLQEAVCFGLYNICEMLLENGAAPDTPGVENKTALHEAVIKNKFKEAVLLLRYDASQNVFDDKGKKPIDYCTTKEMRKIFSQANLLNETREKFGEMNSTQNRSVESSISNIVILACGLSQSTLSDLSKLASKYKVKILNTFVPNVTHVILEVESDEQPFRKLTYDILLSILHGKWILISDWIRMCLLHESQDLREVDLEPFEVKCLTYDGTPTRARINAEKQNPGLFNNCSFFFALSSTATYTVADISLTKKSLVRLVSEGGGTCLSREPNPEDAAEVKRIPFHVAHDEKHPLHHCSHYIIYSPGKEEPRMKYKMPHLKSLPLVWFIECLERFTLVDPGLYGI